MRRSAIILWSKANIFIFNIPCMLPKRHEMMNKSNGFENNLLFVSHEIRHGLTQDRLLAQPLLSHAYSARGDYEDLFAASH